jgi:hypothetical protein
MRNIRSMLKLMSGRLRDRVAFLFSPSSTLSFSAPEEFPRSWCKVYRYLYIDRVSHLVRKELFEKSISPKVSG